LSAGGLRPMRDDEFESFLPEVRDGYAEGMIEHAGMSEEAAWAKAEADSAALFPDGKLVPEQSVYVVEAMGEPVGVLWLCERQVDGVDVLWIYDVQIEEEH
jgi:hypothetical protein